MRFLVFCYGVSINIGGFAMSTNEKNNQQNQTSTFPIDNPLLSVETADPATQNRTFELEEHDDSNDK